MYKLSDKAIEVLSLAIKDSNKKEYKLSKKEDMLEFCMGLAFLTSLTGKSIDTVEKKEMVEKINSALEEIGNHIDEIDYEDLNKRIKL